MAFPQVAATNSGNQATDTTTHTINLPSGIVAGQLLMIFFANDGAVGNTDPTGWTNLNSSLTGSLGLSVWYKIATGSEGSTATVTLSGGATEQSAHVTYRITGWHGTTPPDISIVTTGTGAVPNPPSNNVSWGAEDNLWVAVWAWDDGTTDTTAYPTLMPDNHFQARANTSSGVGIATASLNSAVSTVDPNAAALSASEAWKAYTIAVRPGTAGLGVPPSANYTETHEFLDYVFTDTSTDSDGTIVSRLWNFGDGSSTSTATNPTHSFPASGTYNVSLTVTDSQGLTDTETKSLVVEAPPLDASFTAEGEGLVVTFTDTSTDPDAAVTGWVWTFGDSSGSILQNPVHTYSAAGTYTVRLTVTNSLGQTDFEEQTFTVGDEVAYNALHNSLPNLPDLTWATGYSYRAQFRDVNGLEGPFSELVKFKTDTAPFAPSKLAPANGLVTPEGFLTCVVSDPDLDDDIQSVTFEVLALATETMVSGYPKTAIGPFPNGSTVSFDANDDLTLGNGYRWRAKASDGTLTSEWSPWVSFQYTLAPTAHMLAPVSGLVNAVPSPSAEYVDAYVLSGTDTDMQLVRTLEEGPAFGSRVYEFTKNGGNGIASVGLDLDSAIPVTDDYAFLSVYARTVTGSMSALLYLNCYDNNGTYLGWRSPNTHTDGDSMTASTALSLTWHQYGMFTSALPAGTATVVPAVDFSSGSVGVAQLDAFQVNFIEALPPENARMWYGYFDGDFVGYVPDTYTWAGNPGESSSTGVNVLSSREPTVYFNYEGLAAKTKDRLYVEEWNGKKWSQIYDSKLTSSNRTAIPIPSGKLKNQAAYRLKIELTDADSVVNTSDWFYFEVRLLGPTEVIVTTVGQDPDTATLNIAWEPSQLDELEFIAYEVAVETARFGEKRVARITDPATTDYVYPFPISGLQHTIKVRQVKAEAGDELASRWSGGLLSVEYDHWFIKDLNDPLASYLDFDVITGDTPAIGRKANITAFRPQGRRLPVHYLGEERAREGSVTVRIGYAEDSDTRLYRLYDLIENREVCILGLNPSHKVFAMLADPTETLTDRPWLVAFDVPWQETEYEEDVFIREGR